MTYTERIQAAYAEIQQVLDRHNVKLMAMPEGFGDAASLWIVAADNDGQGRCVATAGTWTPLSPR